MGQDVPDGDNLSRAEFLVPFKIRHLGMVRRLQYQMP